MPEGPELHLATRFVRNIGHRHFFSGAVVKSEVSLKNPDVPWNRPRYRVDAVSRGKEMKVLLEEVKDSKSEAVSPRGKQTKVPTPKDSNSEAVSPRGKQRNVPLADSKSAAASTSVLFHFGMSGKFEWTTKAELPKHAHLRFFAEKEDMVLSFVDYRRFGRWFVDADWSGDRGPCVITEPQLFRQNILDHLEDKAFNKPLCEAMLNQKFFNGVGNYLRAEVLYRLNIRPFELARSALAPLAVKIDNQKSNVEKYVEQKHIACSSDDANAAAKGTAMGKKGRRSKRQSLPEVKLEEEEEEKADDNESIPTSGQADLLETTHRLAKEVVGLGFDGGYFSETRDKWESGFGLWLRCYFKEGMSNIKDHNGRTMWYHGEAGPMAPIGAKRNVGMKNKKEAKDGEAKKKSVKKVKKEEPEVKGTKDAEEKIVVVKTESKDGEVKKKSVKKEEPEVKGTKDAEEKIVVVKTESKDGEAKKKSVKKVKKEEPEEKIVMVKEETTVVKKKRVVRKKVVITDVEEEEKEVVKKVVKKEVVITDVEEEEKEVVKKEQLITEEELVETLAVVEQESKVVEETILKENVKQEKGKRKASAQKAKVEKGSRKSARLEAGVDS